MKLNRLIFTDEGGDPFADIPPFIDDVVVTGCRFTPRPARDDLAPACMNTRDTIIHGDLPPIEMIERSKYIAGPTTKTNLCFATAGQPSTAPRLHVTA